MLCNRQTNSARELVGVALDEALEGLVQIELGIDIVRGSIEHSRRLVALLLAHGFDIDSLTTLHIDGHVVLLVGYHAIVQLYILAKTTTKHLAQQHHIVLFQIFVHVHTRYLHEESPAVFIVVLEDDRREPCSVLLLSDVFLNQMKAVVPKRLWIFFHAAVVVLLNIFLKMILLFRMQSSHFFLK